MTLQTQHFGSLELRGVIVDANVTLDTQPVAVALLPHDSYEVPVFVLVDWAGDPGMTRIATFLVGPGGLFNPARGLYDVLVRVTDNPEVPIIKAFELEIA